MTDVIDFYSDIRKEAKSLVRSLFGGIDTVTDINKSADRNTLNVYTVMSDNVPDSVRANIAKHIENKVGSSIYVIMSSVVEELEDTSDLANYFETKFKGFGKTGKYTDNFFDRLVGSINESVDNHEFDLSDISFGFNTMGLNEARRPKPVPGMKAVTKTGNVDKSKATVDEALKKVRDQISKSDLEELSKLNVNTFEKATRDALDEISKKYNLTLPKIKDIDSPEYEKFVSGLPANVQEDLFKTVAQKALSNAATQPTSTPASSSTVTKSESKNSDSKVKMTATVKSSSGLDKLRNSRKDSFTTDGTVFNIDLKVGNGKNEYTFAYRIISNVIVVPSDKLLSAVTTARGNDNLYNYVKLRQGEASFFKDFLFNMKSIKHRVKSELSQDTNVRILNDLIKNSGGFKSKFLADVSEFKHYLLCITDSEIAAIKANNNNDLNTTGGLTTLFESMLILKLLVVNPTRNELAFFSSNNPHKHTLINYSKLDSSDDATKLFQSLMRNR